VAGLVATEAARGKMKPGPTCLYADPLVHLVLLSRFVIIGCLLHCYFHPVPRDCPLSGGAKCIAAV
jgi:hypothetical protein